MKKKEKQRLLRLSKVQNKMNSLLKVLWRGKYPYPSVKNLPHYAKWGGWGGFDNDCVQKIVKHFAQLGYIELIKRSDGRYDWKVK